MPPLSLIDTDILSELFKKHPKVEVKAQEYLQKHTRFTISHIQKYEILKGLKAKKADKQINIFKRFCAKNDIVSITDDVIEKASDIYASLKLSGNLISDADIFVAAIAITNNLVLITNNINHFNRIKGLKLDNWKI